MKPTVKRLNILMIYQDAIPPAVFYVTHHTYLTNTHNIGQDPLILSTHALLYGLFLTKHLISTMVDPNRDDLKMQTI